MVGSPGKQKQSTNGYSIIPRSRRGNCGVVAGSATLGRSLRAARALVELQRRFLICKVDLTGRTRGTYSYIWDLAERFWPQAFVDARHTTPLAARSNMRGQLHQFGLLSGPQLEQRLFLWT